MPVRSEARVMSSVAPPWVLGVSLSHNGAACLMRGNEIVVAIQEERLSRRKRARLEPDRHSLAVQYCLDAAKIGAGELAMIGVCSQPALPAPAATFLLQHQLETAKHGTPIVTLSHHAGHAAHAFATSGFADAAILVVDGMGSPARAFSADENAARRYGPADGWESISLYDADARGIRAVEKHVVARGEWLIRRARGMPLFRSLGGMYSAVAQQLFGEEMEAGHVMGLAPYGEADIPVSQFYDVVDGAFLFKDAVPERFASNARWPEDEVRYRNLAASVQRALESAILTLAGGARALTGRTRLCYAGGVALNVTTNERLHRESGFSEIWIPGAAEDSGPAIGAGFHALWTLNGERRVRAIRSDAFGTPYRGSDIDTALQSVPGLREQQAGAGVIEEAARRLARGEILGWLQGGSELGPRALGHRSILADPRDAAMKERLNARVKFRQPFRPFAPAVLLEHASDWFEPARDGDNSPLMLRAWPVKAEQRARVPAIVHVDGTGRAQTVDGSENPPLRAVLEVFYRLTGVPMLINTSFNVRGEPIVETPEDALWCFLMTGIDACVIEDRLITKAKGRDALLARRPRVIATLRRGVAGDPIPCEVITPWGPRTTQLSPHAWPLLQLCDGKGTIATVITALQQRSAEPLPADGLLDLIVYLRRARVIELL